MQLKVYLLIASVLNVACLNVEKDSSSLRDIFADVAPMRMNKSIESVKKDPSSFVELLADVAPMRMNQSVELLKKDPSSFVELFAGANPDVINQVIGLLETLVSEADSSLTTLTDRVTETSNNFVTANNELVAAQDALTAASTAKLNAENAETAAKEKHDTAKAEKDAAQNSFDDQSPTYLEEKRVLQEVIEKLRPLSGSQCFRNCGFAPDSSGVYRLCPTGQQEDSINVYCDQVTDGGGWMLLLSQSDSNNQFEGSVNPLTVDMNVDKPDPLNDYSRNWGAISLETPVGGSQFMIKRGSSGQYVRMVQDPNAKFCGFGDQTIDCNTGINHHHGFYTVGKTYNENGDLLNGITYFNGCNYGGGCGSSGVDGIGFGDLVDHLRATHGDQGYGGTAWPGGLRWNQEAVDTGANLPYTYWYKAGN